VAPSTCATSTGSQRPAFQEGTRRPLLAADLHATAGTVDLLRPAQGETPKINGDCLCRFGRRQDDELWRQRGHAARPLGAGTATGPTIV
jgi:hypothetical protein